jgi:DNA ligase (NAD+)
LNIEFYKEKIIENKNNMFFWKKVCITWSFWEIKRPDLIKELEEVWWKFITSVSKNTDFLVAWEKAWSKLKKAEELWIKILDLTKFKKEL